VGGRMEFANFFIDLYSGIDFNTRCSQILKKVSLIDGVLNALYYTNTIIIYNLGIWSLLFIYIKKKHDGIYFLPNKKINVNTYLQNTIVRFH